MIYFLLVLIIPIRIISVLLQLIKIKPCLNYVHHPTTPNLFHQKPPQQPIHAPILAVDGIDEEIFGTTNNEYLQRVYEKMQNEEEHVKQLDVKLNAPSETVKKRNEVHKDIKDSIRYIKGIVEGSLLSPFTTDRANAEYICKGLEGLIDLKSMTTSIAATTNTIETIRHTVDDDGALANALMELDLMNRVEILYKQG